MRRSEPFVRLKEKTVYLSSGAGPSPARGMGDLQTVADHTRGIMV